MSGSFNEILYIFLLTSAPGWDLSADGFTASLRQELCLLGPSTARIRGQGPGCAHALGCKGAEPAPRSCFLPSVVGFAIRKRLLEGQGMSARGGLELHPISAPPVPAPSSPRESLRSGGLFSCWRYRIWSEPVPCPSVLLQWGSFACFLASCSISAP